VADPIIPPEDAQDESEEVYIRRQFKLLLYRLHRLPETVRARVQGHLAQVLMEHTVSIETSRGPLSFVTLGRLGGARGMKMLTKQPATIEWIDCFRPGSVFWDVGANVGVYTLYAAQRGDTNVVAFEPAAVNYFLLTANCEVNHFDRRVQCLLAGLGDARAVAQLEVSQFAVAQSFSFLGKKQPYAFQQSAFLLSMDQLVEEYGVPCPNYIKVDVPGLTTAILAGGARTLRRNDVRELHIEAKESSATGRRIIETMRACGLVLANASTHGSTDLTFVRSGS